MWKHLQGASMQPKPWKITLFSGLFLFVVLTLSIYSQLEIPAPGGAFVVGQTIMKWVDASRPEVLTEDPNDFREVVAVMWYPAEAGSGRQAGYFPNLSSVAKALIQSGELEGWEVF